MSSYDMESLFLLADEEFPNGWKLTGLEFIVVIPEKIKCVGAFSSACTILLGASKKKVSLPICNITELLPLLEEIGIWEVQQFFGKKYGNILFDRVVYDEIKKSLAINYTACKKSIQVTMHHDIRESWGMGERLERMYQVAPKKLCRGTFCVSYA